MSRLAYESATGPEAVSLDGPAIFAGTACALRGRQLSYTLGTRGAGGISRRAREVSLDITSVDAAALDALGEVLDRDAAAGEPGSLVVDGVWRTGALAVAQDVKRVSPWSVSAALKLVLADGVWRRRKTTEFAAPVASGPAGLDLPCDLPCDLGSPPARSVLSVGGRAPAWARITVYGPAINPSVVIGANRYQVDATVPAGGYMVVDGMAGTVEVVDGNGDVASVFAKAHRGGGAGRGEYIFEKIAPGEHEVSWSRGFGFDVTVYEERGEPPWS